MNNSPLRYLNDYDIISILNEIVPKKYNFEYHKNRFKNKNTKYNLNCGNYSKINSIFQNINIIRLKCKNVSFIQPVFPFYYRGNTFCVKHAVNIYEKISKNLF